MPGFLELSFQPQVTSWLFSPPPSSEPKAQDNLPLAVRRHRPAPYLVPHDDFGNIAQKDGNAIFGGDLDLAS